MSMKARYTNVDGQIIAERRSGTRSNYVPDSVGSTIALTDDVQNVSDIFSYWPFGEISSWSGASLTSFRFGGTDGYYSTPRQVKYARPGWLSSDQGRWLSPKQFGAADAREGTRYALESPTTALETFIPTSFSGLLAVSGAGSSHATVRAAAPVPFPNIPQKCSCGVASKSPFKKWKDRDPFCDSLHDTYKEVCKKSKPCPAGMRDCILIRARILTALACAIGRYWFFDRCYNPDPFNELDQLAKDNVRKAAQEALNTVAGCVLRAKKAKCNW